MVILQVSEVANFACMYVHMSESIDVILIIYSMENSPQEFRLESHSILLIIPIFLWISLFKSINAKGSLA